MPNTYPDPVRQIYDADKPRDCHLRPRQSVWAFALDFFVYLLLAALMIVTLGLIAVSAKGQPIPGFHPWINVDGINASYTYIPFDTSADGFKDPWLNAVKGLSPAGFRFMDWRQTNGSPIVNWADRPTIDTDIRGVSEETQIRLANTVNAAAWINAPHKSTIDYSARLGTMWGGAFKGPVLKWEYSNEFWRGGDQAQGTYNLQQAIAEGYPGPSDTEKMAQRAAWEGYQRFTAFKANAIAAGYKGKVEWEWGGFIVNPYWTTWGMEELKRRGVNPGAVGIRLAVAPYAPGSPTDVNINPADSHAVTIGKFMAFGRNSIVPWIQANRATANAYGLLGVDTYEAAIGSTYTLDNAALTDYMIALNNDPLMRQAERDYVALVLDALGTDAEGKRGVYDVFGLYGIPFSQYGQWPLLNVDQLTTLSPKYLGVLDAVDRASVPEPAALALLGLAAALALLCRRRAAPFAPLLVILIGLLAVPAGAQTTQPTTRPAVTYPTGYVVAWYYPPFENLAKVKALGCNAVVGPELGNPRRQTVQQWCAEADRLGLKVIGDAKLLENGGFRPPNLIATIVRDEPTSANHNYTPEATAAEADAFRKLAPDLPVICNHAGDKLTSAGAKDYALYERFVKAVDVSWADWYPINREYGKYPLTFKRDEVLFLKARGAGVLGSVIETSWQQLNKGDKTKGRTPTPDELEQEVNLAVGAGATWIVYFSTCQSGAYGWPQSYDPTPPDVAARITLVNARLNPPAATQPTTLPTTVPTTQPTTQPDPAIAALRMTVEEQAKALATVQDRQKALDVTLDRLRDVLNTRGPPATQPTTGPTTQPVSRVNYLFTGERIAGIAAMPNANHVNWLHLSLWNEDGAGGSINNPYDIPMANAARIGALCATGGIAYASNDPNHERPVPIVKGATMMVDFESFYNVPGKFEPVSAEKWAKMRDLIREIRKAAPGVPVVLYGAAGMHVPWYWQYVRDHPEILPKIGADYGDYKILLDEVDAIVQDFCVLSRTTDVEESLAVYAKVAAAVRSGTGKPVWGLLDPHYRGEQTILLPPAVARRNLELCLKANDAALIWAGWNDYRATFGSAGE